MIKSSGVIMITVRLLLIFLMSQMLAGSVSAHVQLDYPVGGETFVAGEIVTIQWHVVVPHNQNNWDLYYTPDGGQNWEVIQLDLDLHEFNYQWTVPQVTSENVRIRIIMDNNGGDYIDISNNFIIRETPSSVESEGKNPKTFKLGTNYPNPFNPTTTINYELPGTSDLELTIYNQLGQEVRTLIKNRQPANIYKVQWDGRDNTGKPVTSGLYFYRLMTNSFSQTRKMMLLR